MNNISLWIITSFIAVALVIDARVRITRGATPDAEFAADGPALDSAHRIGGVELAVAALLVLPGLLKIVPVLVPVAACGVVVLMVLALVRRDRSDEGPRIAGIVAMIAGAVYVAAGRFGTWAL
ncbi:DoxX family protein [Mariniluteicoccus flavus]